MPVWGGGAGRNGEEKGKREKGKKGVRKKIVRDLKNKTIPK